MKKRAAEFVPVPGGPYKPLKLSVTAAALTSAGFLLAATLVYLGAKYKYALVRAWILWFPSAHVAAGLPKHVTNHTAPRSIGVSESTG